MAQAFAQAKGSCFMITPEMTVHRSAWNAYFRIKGMGREATPWRPAPKSVMRIMLEKHQKYGVPAEWPWQFDQSISEDMLGNYKSMDELSRHNPNREFDAKPSGDEEQRKAFVARMKSELRRPNPDIYKNMAPSDPNRLSKPKGWA